MENQKEISPWICGNLTLKSIANKWDIDRLLFDERYGVNGNPLEKRKIVAGIGGDS